MSVITINGILLILVRRSTRSLIETAFVFLLNENDQKMNRGGG